MAEKRITIELDGNTLDFGNLVQYIEEDGDKLLSKAVLGARSLDGVAVMLDVKDRMKIGKLEHTVTLTNGLVCGFNPSGETKISDRQIEVGWAKSEKAYCDTAFKPYIYNAKLNIAAGKEVIPFYELFMQKEVEAVANVIEKAFYQGDKTSANANLNKWNGLNVIVDSSGLAIEGNTGYVASATELNILGIVDNLIRLIPEELKGKPLEIRMGTDLYSNYMMALKNANLNHYYGDASADFKFKVPGFPYITLAGYEGLTGTGRMFLMDWSTNAIFGTDSFDDAKNIKAWFDDTTELYCSRIRFAGGVQVAFPDEIVSFTPEGVSIAAALTTPTPDANNTITVVQTSGARTIAIAAAKTTASVVITGTKTALQTVTIGGTDKAKVTATGTATAPIYTIDTSAIKTTGGTYTFTLSVAQKDKLTLVYTVTVVVAGD